MNTAPLSGRVVLLNGVGSVGKSSIARALQALTREPYLHVQMDTFLDMLPAKYMGHPDGLQFVASSGDGPAEIEIRSGPMVVRLLEGMRHAVDALARRGNNLIVDDVLLDGEAAAYRETLADLDFTCVGIVAPLDMIEARERLRGDRDIGLARWQFERVHRGIHYDLLVDASEASPSQCAAQIRDCFNL